MGSDDLERFVQSLTECQTRLYGYVYSLLGDHGHAADVVQEINLVLWRKFDEFDFDKPFMPWAFAIARFQVLAHLRDRKRDRILLDPELAETICAEVEGQSEYFEGLQAALRGCLETLTPKHRDLIENRYAKSKTLADLAVATERTEGAIKVALLRLRRLLADCVQKRIAAEA